MNEFRVAVLGPGGVGGLLAATLARQGADVVCIAKPETAATIAADGITVTSARFGNFHQEVAAEQRLSHPVDLCVVCVKEPSLEQALSELDPAILQDAVLIPFLNGIEHLARLRDRLPYVRTVAGAIRIESFRERTGHIVQRSPFAMIELAPGPESRSTVESFAILARASGFDVELREDEAAVLWGKLMIIAPLALLTTYFSAPAGIVRDEHRSVLQQVLEETATIARANGFDADASAMLALFDSVPSEMRSSMQRDAEAGQPIEIKAIGGALVRAGRAKGVRTPELDRIVAALRNHH